MTANTENLDYTIPITGKPPMCFDYSLVRSGAYFTLEPIKGVHTLDDIARAKRWLRTNRDVVGIDVYYQTKKGE